LYSKSLNEESFAILLLIDKFLVSNTNVLAVFNLKLNESDFSIGVLFGIITKSKLSKIFNLTI
jgi:hypothetical protein